jgi:hypothetical protein
VAVGASWSRVDLSRYAEEVGGGLFGDGQSEVGGLMCVDATCRQGSAACRRNKSDNELALTIGWSRWSSAPAAGTTMHFMDTWRGDHMDDHVLPHLKQNSLLV